MSLPKNQAATYDWAVGNRYKKKPWRTNKHPQNKRVRCTDCSAQFHETTQETKMEMHCLVMGARTSHGGSWGLHHGWRNATGDPFSTNMFRVISDSVDDLRKNYV